MQLKKQLFSVRVLFCLSFFCIPHAFAGSVTVGDVSSGGYFTTTFISDLRSVVNLLGADDAATARSNLEIGSSDSPTFAGFTIDALSITDILDEDAMGSDSAAALATQQSIKAYVDTQVAASDDTDWAEQSSPADYVEAKAGGIAANGATLYGTSATTHINMGFGTSVTGTNGQNYGYATVGGGQDNTASQAHSLVAGGYNNTASGIYTVVLGGSGNTANGSYGSVGGGLTNTAGSYGFVGGGLTNTASGLYSTVAGGTENTATTNYAVSVGGYNNDATGQYTSVVGGRDNVASGSRATVGGGEDNIAAGNYSFAAGRNMQLSADADGSFVFGQASSAQAITQANSFLIFPSGDAGKVGIGTAAPGGTLHMADTFTSGGTDDYTMQVTSTLNDSGAAGGSDVYRGLKMNITETDVTGWDSVYLMDLQTGGTSQFSVTSGGTMTLASGTGVSSILDEDAMGSDSATALATQQSIKAYVDNEISNTAGDVTGPGSSTDNAIARFDGTGGKTLQNSGVTIDDNANVAVAGVTLTSGGTDDYGIELTQTLNDTGAAGGSDVYRGIKLNITETDVTGWDNIYLMDLQSDGGSEFSIDNTGQIRFDGQLLAPNYGGSEAQGASNPAYSFASNPDTGLYYHNPGLGNEMRFVVDGNNDIGFRSSPTRIEGVSSGARVSFSSNSASSPAYAFYGDGNTGIYGGGDVLRITTGGTQRANVDGSGNLTINAQGDIRLADTDSSNYLGFQAPGTVTSDLTWTLPDGDGTEDQVLSTNGSGTLSWISVQQSGSSTIQLTAAALGTCDGGAAGTIAYNTDSIFYGCNGSGWQAITNVPS